MNDILSGICILTWNSALFHSIPISRKIPTYYIYLFTNMDIELLNNLAPEERGEALRIARIAEEAEKRAAQRRLEAAGRTEQSKGEQLSGNMESTVSLPTFQASFRYKSKAEREAEAIARLKAKKLAEEKAKEVEMRGLQTSESNSRVNESVNDRHFRGSYQQHSRNDTENNRYGRYRERERSRSRERTDRQHYRRDGSDNKDMMSQNDGLSPLDDEIKRRYLGASAIVEEERKARGKGADRRTFKWEWDEEEDTSRGFDPLYRHPSEVDRYEPDRRGTSSSQYGRYGGGPRGPPGRGMRDSYDARSDRTKDHGEHGAGANSRRTGRGYDLDDSFAEQSTHWSAKRLEDMTRRDWAIMREDFDIHVRGRDTVNPLRSWDEATIHADIRRAIDRIGYKEPSPIQRQAIPMGLQARDLIGIAETGSGKTAAFLIPLLDFVMRHPERRERVQERGPLAVVMAPTRELAQQIEEECVRLSEYTQTKSVVLVGGTSIDMQAMKLRQGVDIVIGTPGRIIDCLERALIVLSQCDYVVLDEADRMIDMGFEEAVKTILDAMGREGIMNQADDGQVAVRRTTHMFTATMSPDVERLAKTYTENPSIVRIGDVVSGKNMRITQQILFAASEGAKRNVLMKLLKSSPTPLIVFVNARKQCDVVAREIESQRYRVSVLHSSKRQEIREEALADFKEGRTNILVATDVAGRGLDIPDVACVINYDMPSDIDRYTHRIGRTGRAGKTGLAVTILTDDDKNTIPHLKAYLESTKQEVPQELISRISASQSSSRYTNR